MTLPTIYCDFNASAPLRPVVKNIIQETLDCFGNPSSIHSLGRQARGYVERARDKLAQSVNAQPEDIVFTSSGSEANNTILKHHIHNGAKLFVSTIEHACVLNAAPDSEHLPVTSEGIVDINHLKNCLEKTRQAFHGQIVVAVMYANNETGVIQPIDEIAKIAKYYGAYVHCDAVQILGKANLDYASMGVDSLAFSAHKIGGPKGIGAYVARPQLKIAPLIHGGGQERGNRSGTENVTGIAGFGAAVEACFSDDWKHVEKLRDKFETELRKRVHGFHVFGQNAPRMQNTSCFSMPGFTNKVQVISFDLDRICVGSGSACSSGKTKPSHVLKAMGYLDEQILHSTRVSLGWSTTENEVNRLIDVCESIYLRSQKERVVS